ncbi:EamA family transporter [Candidatus Saccharibacteria bacterium]|nr:EamA family transporter [Candidatus Saccharibacteria bacterium]
MSWIVLVVLAVLSDSLRIFVDNYSADVYFKGKGAVSQKLFYGYVYVVAAFIIFAVTGFRITDVPAELLIPLAISGILAGIASIPYFRVLEIDDSTNLGIFVQLSPVLYLILGWFFLGETFSPLQLVAFFLILSASLMVVFTARKKSRKIRMRALLLSLLYVSISVVGNVIFVKVDNGTLDFVKEMGVVILAKGITDVMIVYLNPKWHKRFRKVAIASKFKVFRPLIANSFLNIAKEFTYRGALAAAPAVAIASVSSDSAEPIAIFFLGLILTLIWPKFGRESLDKKTVLVHLTATILIVVGIILMQV